MDGRTARVCPVTVRSEPSHDRQILRDLARRYAAVAADPVQDQRRELWRRHNSLRPTRPLIYARVEGGNAVDELPQVHELQCRDPFWHGVEHWLRLQLFKATLGDDFVFEQFVSVSAVHACAGWGVESARHYSDEPQGSYKVDYVLRSLEDVAKLRPPRHEIDEAKTAERFARVREAIGDIIEVDLNRGPAWLMWTGDLSTDLGYLRGIENLMTDIMMNPEGVHRLVRFMGEGVLRAHDQAEQAGDWGLSNHQNQSIPYAEELPGPKANCRGVKRSQLWGYVASQEFELFGPDQQEEFLLRYQRPILEKFGLAAYGCCENLTGKIDMLRSIPNLRRIAVAPRADLRSCAEQIGADYVISWRPNPAEMICLGCDEQAMRRKIRDGLEICRGLHVDICLKDVTSVQHEPQRFAVWVRAVRAAIEDAWG